MTLEYKNTTRVTYGNQVFGFAGKIFDPILCFLCSKIHFFHQLIYGFLPCKPRLPRITPARITKTAATRVK